MSEKQKGTLRINNIFLEDFIGLKNPEIHINTKRITELPNDIKIVGAKYDPLRDTIELLLEGTGAPLFKVAPHATVPEISIVYTEIKQE